ncbi:hypothetical protein BH09PSE5_BH09PSE5_19570 [soil metagenome]
MKATPKTTMAERAGRTLGRAYRAAMRREAHVVRWQVGKGMPIRGAKATLWITKLAVLGVLLYVAFWLALLLLLVVAVAWLARDANPTEPEEWAIGDQADYKKGVFYDPINYGDDPDPRFDDDR